MEDAKTEGAGEIFRNCLKHMFECAILDESNPWVVSGFGISP